MHTSEVASVFGSGRTNWRVFLVLFFRLVAPIRHFLVPLLVFLFELLSYTSCTFLNLAIAKRRGDSEFHEDQREQSGEGKSEI
jgi:hypothetical protein